MQSLQILFGVVALCAAASAMADVKNLQPQENECTCNEVVNSLCSLHFGTESWYGQFPNARDQDLTQAIDEFFDFRQFLFLDNYCSHMMYNFLCFHYFPKCDLQNRLAASPCRETCNEALTECIDHARAIQVNYTFPAHLNCSNFPSGSSECTSATRCNQPCTACPNATIHLEFGIPAGKTEFSGSEEEGVAEVCLRLANVGSYDPDATLEVEVTANLDPASSSARAGLDFANETIVITFPAGSRKGSLQCASIQIIRDNINEGDEYFLVTADITSPTTDAKFGGGIDSTSGSIRVKIADQYPPVIPTATLPTPTSSSSPATVETPTAMPDPTIPPLECKSSSCNWRNRISGNTFKKNRYTFVALVRVVMCSDSVLTVEMLECNSLECGVCPSTPVRVKLAICTNCVSTTCPTGDTVVIAGGHTDTGTLYISNYKKKGLFAQVRSNWQSFVPDCTQP